MPYWGSKPDECDYAFDTLGSYIVFIKEQMSKDMVNVIDKEYPEQAIIASLKCLRLLGEAFPKCLKVHFRKRQFEKAKTGFTEWYEAVKDKLPKKHREAIFEEANIEFRLFEERILDDQTDQ